MGNTVHPRSFETSKVINGCEYKVVSVFKEKAAETAEQKIIRLIKSRVASEMKKIESSVLRSN